MGRKIKKKYENPKEKKKKKKSKKTRTKIGKFFFFFFAKTKILIGPKKNFSSIRGHLSSQIAFFFDFLAEITI